MAGNFHVLVVDDDPDKARALELFAEAERDHQTDAPKPKGYQLDPTKKFNPKGDMS